MFEKNNPTIPFNILYIKEKEICPAYISKFELWKTNNSISDSKPHKKDGIILQSKKCLGY